MTSKSALLVETNEKVSAKVSETDDAGAGDVTRSLAGLMLSGSGKVEHVKCGEKEGPERELTSFAIIDGMSEEGHPGNRAVQSFFQWVLPRLHCAHFATRPVFRVRVTPGSLDEFKAAVEKAKKEDVRHVFVLLPNELDSPFFDQKKELEFQMVMSLQGIRLETIVTRFHGNNYTGSFDRSALRNLIRRDRLEAGLPETDQLPSLRSFLTQYRTGFSLRIDDGGRMGLAKIARLLAESAGLTPVKMGRIQPSHAHSTAKSFVCLELDVPVHSEDPHSSLPPFLAAFVKALNDICPIVVFPIL